MISISAVKAVIRVTRPCDRGHCGLRAAQLSLVTGRGSETSLKADIYACANF